MWIVVLLTHLFSFSVCFVCGGGWFIVFSFFSDHKSWCSSSSIEWHLTYTQGVLWDATGRTNEILQQGYECTLQIQCGSIATSALYSTLERWVNCNLFQGDGYYELAYKTYNIYVSLPASIIPVSSLLFSSFVNTEFFYPRFTRSSVSPVLRELSRYHSLWETALWQMTLQIQLSCCFLSSEMWPCDTMRQWMCSRGSFWVLCLRALGCNLPSLMIYVENFRNQTPITIHHVLSHNMLLELDHIRIPPRSLSYCKTMLEALRFVISMENGCKSNQFHMLLLST